MGIKLFIFQDDADLFDVDMIDNDDIYPEHFRCTMGRHAIIAGSLFVHYSSFLNRQALYQYDAPRDLIIYDGAHNKTTLGEYFKKLTESLFERGHMITTMDIDHSLFIPENQLNLLSNQKLIHLAVRITHSSLWVELQDEYEEE